MIPFSISAITTFLVFFAPAASLIIPHGIGIGNILLLLLSVLVLARDSTILLLKPEEKHLLAAFGFFSATAFFSVFLLKDPLSELEVPSRFALAIPIYFLLRRFPPSKEAFWLGTAIGAIGGGLFAIYQKFILGLTLAEGHVHHIQFGDVSLILGMTAAIGLPSLKNILWGRHLVIAALALGIIGSILSGARGGWLSIPILLYCLYRFYQQYFTLLYMTQKKEVAIKSLAIGILMVFLLFQTGVSQRIALGVSEIKQYQTGESATSIGLRFELWKASKQIFIAHPLLGVGRSGFLALIKEQVDLRRIHPMTTQFPHAHNDFIDTLAKRGLLGGIALLLILIVPARLFVRSLQEGNALQKPFAMAGLMLILGYLVFSMTENIFFHRLSATYYIFSVIFLYASIMTIREKNPVD
ncbi:MAG: O-antigen ligase family protein [Nitrospirota bacterium]